jgi:hypothetical protein
MWSSTAYDEPQKRTKILTYALRIVKSRYRISRGLTLKGGERPIMGLPGLIPAEYDGLRDSPALFWSSTND